MQKRARKIKNEAFSVGDSMRWEPGMGSLRRRDRHPLVTDNERIDEYLKHRPHYMALGRWINMGKPETALIVVRPLNNRQIREVTRTERQKTHVRQYEIGRAYTTGKSARRRRERAV